MGKHIVDASDKATGSSSKSRRREDSYMDVPSNETCPLCQESTFRWWPHVRVPFIQEGGSTTQRCHFECIHKFLEKQHKTSTKQPGESQDETQIEEAFANDLLHICTFSPQLFGRSPILRLCYEEWRLQEAVVTWPVPLCPVIPRAAFAIEGIKELRISSNAALHQLPPEIGLCCGLISLVIISTGLLGLPDEIGQLHELQQLFVNGNFIRTVPASVGTLPALQELCLDSNLIECLPSITCPNLRLLTAPANKLVTLPELSGRPESLLLHGNNLTSFSVPGGKIEWHRITHLKLMGNKLRELPEAMGQMVNLRTLLVGANYLHALPNSLTSIPYLEWIFAYSNALVKLPERMLLNSKWIDRVLLEGNPLSEDGLIALITEASESKIRVLGLDTLQVKSYYGASKLQEALPPCVSVGSLVQGADVSRYYLKMVRASQLRRSSQCRANGEPGGPLPPELAPADTLVVAFAASQGEPEWMGVLRRIAARGRVSPLPVTNAPVSDLIEGGISAEVRSDPEAIMSAFWAEFRSSGAGPESKLQEETPDSCEADFEELADFDVLSVIDPRMRWYAEHEDELAEALAAAVKLHKRCLFVGASMGGFGALFHGGLLADAALAFGPQSRLDQATLRPPGESTEALAHLCEKLQKRIAHGISRGARMEVHCAADEHCWHALALPLEDMALTVHPLLPRKPFAKLLDKAHLLEPILSDALFRLQQRPPATRGDPLVIKQLAYDSIVTESPEQKISISRWGPQGKLTRCWTSRPALVKLFFSPGMPYMPRPGDWFCPKCHKRNMSCSFFCHSCGVECAGANIASPEAARVPGGPNFPQIGDWGCGCCGRALCGYEWYCYCGADKSHARAVVVA